MKVRIIKGTNQIGGCITEIISTKGRIIIDLGMKVSDVLRKVKPSNPNIEGLTTGTALYDGLLITHIHDDHIGLIKYVLDEIPIYIEKDSKRVYEIIKNKKINHKIVTFEFDKPFKIKGLIITPYQNDHSCYNSAMFLIKNNKKSILHVGDCRNHGYLSNLFISNLKKCKNVDLLIADGTSLGKAKDYMSEEMLSNRLKKEIYPNYNQILSFISLTNSDRILSFYYAKGNKKFYLNKEHENIYKGSKIKELDINKNNQIHTYNDKIESNFILTVRVNMLDEIKRLKQEGKLDNACLVYSMAKKYLLVRKEIRDFILEIKRLGIKVIFLQTSGHADNKTLSYIEKVLKPKKCVIIHTKHNKQGKRLLNSYIYIKDNEVLEV